jgi:hypothetical protein
MKKPLGSVAFGLQHSGFAICREYKKRRQNDRFLPPSVFTTIAFALCLKLALYKETNVDREVHVTAGREAGASIVCTAGR